MPNLMTTSNPKSTISRQVDAGTRCQMPCHSDLNVRTAASGPTIGRHGMGLVHEVRIEVKRST